MKLFTAAMAAFLTATTAFAAPNCASTEDVISLLTQRYGELPVAKGMDASGQLVIFWGNTETGSWTATVTVGDQTCVVGHGGQFERFERQALEPNV